MTPFALRTLESVLRVPPRAPREGEADVGKS